MEWKRTGRDKKGVDWRWVKCIKCNGSGINDNRFDKLFKEKPQRSAGEWEKLTKDFKKCKRCKGKGYVKRSYWNGEDYWFDLDAVREPHEYDGRKDTLYKGGPKDVPIGAHERWPNPAGKNPGDVWQINTEPYPDAHYATFPQKLVKKCLLAGCPKEICKKCGLARVRMVKTKTLERYELDKSDPRYRPARYKGKYDQGMRYAEHQTIGWTDCGCDAGWRPGVMLDPFCGSGTALKVGIELGLDVIGVDLKEEYIEKHAKKRLSGAQLPLIK